MIGDKATEWTIGELAAAAGVTVRTLHHYDRLGLLRPLNRTPATHRRYGAAQAERLYRIVALRSLGFPLPTIRVLLNTDTEETLREELVQARPGYGFSITLIARSSFLSKIA